MLSILQRLPLLPLNSSGILYPRNKSQELFPVNVEKVLVILKGAKFCVRYSKFDCLRRMPSFKF